MSPPALRNAYRADPFTTNRMSRAPLGESARAGLLLAASGVLAWGTGEPFVFPSLGPTAYLLARGSGDELTARRVVGGHAVGVVAGLLAYHLLLSGGTVTAARPAFATTNAAFALAGVVSVALTAGGMAVTDTDHAPACATTLIVALGVISSPTGAGVIVVSVAALYGLHRVAA